MELEGKRALVTGAGSGIGRAAAKLLGARGARVACVDRTQEGLERIAEEIRLSGREALGLAADVALSDAMKRAYEAVYEHFGGLDIVVANAGVNGVWAPISDISEEEWDKVMAINLKGTFLTVKHAIPLLERQGGSIVVTSSVNGTRMFSNSGASAYATTKAGQAAFAKMAALELAKRKVRVNVICPGAISTGIGENTTLRRIEEAKEPVIFPEGEIPLTDGHPGTAEQVAELIAFLASDRASHITGTEVLIDGGQSLLQG